MRPTFKTGEIVELISGGPRMTIQEIFGEIFDDEDEYQQARCQWFDGQKLEQGVFPAKILKESRGQVSG